MTEHLLKNEKQKTNKKIKVINLESVAARTAMQVLSTCSAKQWYGYIPRSNHYCGRKRRRGQERQIIKRASGLRSAAIRGTSRNLSQDPPELPAMYVAKLGQTILCTQSLLQDENRLLRSSFSNPPPPRRLL